MLWAVQMYFNDTMRVVTVADIIGVHRSTVYNWINRYEDRGKDGLRYKSRKPHTTYKIPEDTVEEIVQLYNKGYGCLRISYELKVGHTTAWRYLVKLGIIKRGKKKRRKWNHFQRKHSNSLWQIDLTCIDDENDIWALVGIDDHSRFVPLFHVIHGSPSIDDILPALEETFLEYGVPKQILTDRGTQFYSVRGGVSTFDMWLHELCVKHILASRKHPQTNGKVERVIQTFKNECIEKIDWTKETIQEKIDLYREEYNFHRLHMIYKEYHIYGRDLRRREMFYPFLRFSNHG